MTENPRNNYMEMRFAILRAEQEGFDIRISTEYMRLEHKKYKSPENNFYTAAEIHNYLNGINDGYYRRDAGKVKGAKARAEKLSPVRRKEIAEKAAKARWKKRHEKKGWGG